MRYEDIIDQIKSEMKLLRMDISDIRSGIKITGGGSNVRNLDLLFKKHFEDTKCEYLSISNTVFKENLEDRRELSTLIGLLSWPIFNTEDSSPTVGVKNFKSITKTLQKNVKTNLLKQNHTSDVMKSAMKFFTSENETCGLLVGKFIVYYIK